MKNNIELLYNTIQDRLNNVPQDKILKLDDFFKDAGYEGWEIAWIQNQKGMSRLMEDFVNKNPIERKAAHQLYEVLEYTHPYKNISFYVIQYLKEVFDLKRCEDYYHDIKYHSIPKNALLLNVDHPSLPLDWLPRHFTPSDGSNRQFILPDAHTCLTTYTNEWNWTDTLPEETHPNVIKKLIELLAV